MSERYTEVFNNDYWDMVDVTAADEQAAGYPRYGETYQQNNSGGGAPLPAYRCAELGYDPDTGALITNTPLRSMYDYPEQAA